MAHSTPALRRRPSQPMSWERYNSRKSLSRRLTNQGNPYFGRERTIIGGDCQVAWARACHIKEDGGLGMKGLHSQNLCFLLKSLHNKQVTGADIPWVRWIMQEYEPFKTGFRTSPKYSDTWMARLMPLHRPSSCSMAGHLLALYTNRCM